MTLTLDVIIRLPYPTWLPCAFSQETATCETSPLSSQCVPASWQQRFTHQIQDNKSEWKEGSTLRLPHSRLLWQLHIHCQQAKWQTHLLNIFSGRSINVLLQAGYKRGHERPNNIGLPCDGWICEWLLTSVMFFCGWLWMSQTIRWHTARYVLAKTSHDDFNSCKQSNPD